ncbi:MAG: putative glycosyltransferase, partial [Ilumatobacteraceae bacterium]|nr:putative glycosyltransferase [Ilumatobacteraceae bacterium]
MSAPTDHGTAVTVAFDGGPLLGSITGIGAAVAEMQRSLQARDDVSLRPYALSFRGTLLPGMTRLPLPAAVAQRLWPHIDRPRLDRWLRPAEVLHGTNYAVGPSRLPRLVSVYDCWFLRNPRHASPVVVRAGEVLRRAVRTGATVHASSHATADAVRELLGTERVEVVPLAALPSPVHPADRPSPGLAAQLGSMCSRPFVLSMGTLERRKNVPTLITAFAAIAGELPDLGLVLAGGDGDDAPEIDAAVAALPPAVAARVVRTGRVGTEDKHWLLANARVLAYPSLDEGFGFPLLEAMQFDLPVVASTRGSIPEVAADAALLVEPLDSAALGQAILSAATDDPLRSTLIAAGRLRIDAFSWPETARHLAALYHRLA